jgi:protein involved in polysaccharide export with SLBB domain
MTIEHLNQIKTSLFFLLSFTALHSSPLPLTDTTNTTEVAATSQEQVSAGRMIAAHDSDLKRETKRFAFDEDGLAIFGSQLFQGEFSDLSFSGFNPNYQIGVGDQIQIMIWGAMDTTLELSVDAKGNIFIPKVGPVPLLGVRNEDINSIVSIRIQEVYKDNIESYANLRSTQTVKVFVSGFVEKPGLYQGFASDSVLYFIDQSGGVDAMRGSYRSISLVRNKQTVSSVNLYDFLKDGSLPLSQFRDGDVILVGPRGHSIKVTGEVINSALFEFEGNDIPLSEVLELASPNHEASSVSIRRVQNGVSSAQVVDMCSRG